MLMHHRDAVRKGVARTVRPIRRAVQPHGARIGLMHAEHHIAQCRFAGAVLAQQAMHFAREEFERDAAQRLKLAETLVDAVHAQDSGARRVVTRVGRGALTGQRRCASGRSWSDVHLSLPRP